MNATSLDEIAKAIFTVNRHAKTAPEPQHLYYIKKMTIKKLLDHNDAKKIGLHFSNHPKYSNQHSTLLVQVGNYYFHVPPMKQDFKKLEHLGTLDQNHRNPSTKMALSYAKKVIYHYIDLRPAKRQKTAKKRHRSSYYTPSSLGKMEWPPKKSPRH